MKPLEAPGGTPAQASLKGVYISTYGCQMNVNDTERMYSLLEMANYTPVSSPDQADVIIINACSVREKPVHKVYSEAGTYRKLKEKRPHLKVGVGGCVGSLEKDRLLDKSKMIDFVFGTDNIDELPQIVERAMREKAVVHTPFHHREPYHIETMVRNPGVSTFVNITKGCDNFCSFCVVPFTRGREKSRPLKHLQEDIQKLTARGVREVTLLGQNVNSYKSECGADFADLLDLLAAVPDLLRIRFTTSHPKDFNEKLVKVMAKNYPKICEYVHLPFQSGNNRILQLMNRGYTREEYLDRIAMIRSYLPQVVFSTDVIVGFPSESEEEFLETLDLVERVGYETIFAFKYSPRPFTKAARMEGHLPEHIKEDRLSRLFVAFDDFAKLHAKKYEGQILQVLVEKKEKTDKWFGRSGQNKNVYFSDNSNADLMGKMVAVKIERAYPNVLHGIALSAFA
jgi:tRNA-2-methylthio-N6-dimethylallyladenosine synthase